MKRWVGWLNSRSLSLLVATNFVWGVLSCLFFYYGSRGPGVPGARWMSFAYTLIVAAVFSNFVPGMRKIKGFLVAWVSMLAGIVIVLAIRRLIGA